jgi:3-methyladenine DNA glycosylase AlkC
VIPFRLDKLPQGCERLSTTYATEAEARTAGQALDTSFLVERQVVIHASSLRRQKKGQPQDDSYESTETYHLILCPDEIRREIQRDFHDRLTRARQLYFQGILDDSTIDPGVRSLLAICIELACPWPKPLMPEEQQKADAAHARKMRQMKRERKKRAREFDAELAQDIANYAAEKQQVQEAIAQGIASPWKQTPEEQRWVLQERERMLQEWESKRQRKRQEELHAFLTREATLGGIACTWKPSPEVLTQRALEQGIACPWPDPNATSRPRGRTALTPRNMQRLKKIIATHRRRPSS